MSQQMHPLFVEVLVRKRFEWNDFVTQNVILLLYMFH